MERFYYSYNGRVRGLGYSSVVPNRVVIGNHREGLLFGKIVDDELHISFFLYEENNRLYEFFSGEYVATRNGKRIVREPNNLFLTEIDHDYGTLDYDIRAMPATTFANSVKSIQEKYTAICNRHHTQLADIMRNQIRRIDLMYYESEEKKAAEMQRAKREEEESKSWLDNYLGHR